MEKKETVKQEIGKRIEFIRNSKKMTKEEFAKLIDITGQHLGKVILGEKGLSLEKIVEVSDKTGYSTDFILKGKVCESEIMNEKVNLLKDKTAEIDDILKTML